MVAKTSCARRERWHGKGNFANFNTAYRSTVAIFTQFFAAAHLLAAIALIGGFAWISGLLALAVVVLCFGSAARRYGFGLPRLLITTVLHYAYFAGRSLALLDRLLGAGGLTRAPSRGTPR